MRTNEVELTANDIETFTAQLKERGEQWADASPGDGSGLSHAAGVLFLLTQDMRWEVRKLRECEAQCEKERNQL